ncbi:MAG: YvrJ family protein [Firmicutes bacterium]|nr:YvrJ family protein [Bacillota bacterium]
MDPWMNALGTVGFPIVITFYLLTKLEPAIRSLEKTVTVLTVVVAKQNNIDYTDACKMVGKEEN